MLSIICNMRVNFISLYERKKNILLIINLNGREKLNLLTEIKMERWIIVYWFQFAFWIFRKFRFPPEIAKTHAENFAQFIHNLLHNRHIYIDRFPEMINEVFNQVVFVQFFASILILCSSVYYLSSHITVEDFVKLVIYTFCMFVQIYVYCWAGNEVILKVNHNFSTYKKTYSEKKKENNVLQQNDNWIIIYQSLPFVQSTGLSEAVYEINWTLVTVSEQKDLLMIMKHSTRSIKFTSSFLVTLSLESYANVSTTMDIFFDTAYEYNLRYSYTKKMLFYFIDSQNVLLCV